MKCWKRHIDTDDNGIPIAFKPIDNVGGIDAAFLRLVHRQMQRPIGREGFATGIAPLAHQLLGQKTGRTLWLFEHPRLAGVEGYRVSAQTGECCCHAFRGEAVVTNLIEVTGLGLTAQCRRQAALRATR